MAKFNFKGLSPETRLIIYPLAFNLMQGFDDNTPPALLLALKDVNPGLYDEAYELYLKLNATITLENVDSFKKIARKQMIEIQHLKIIFDKPVERPRGQDLVNMNIKLRGHRSTLINHFETIICDYTSSAAFIEQAASVPTYMLRILSKASGCLRRVGIPLMVVKGNDTPEPVDILGPSLNHGLSESDRAQLKTKLIESVNRGLGIAGKLEAVGPTGSPGSEDSGRQIMGVC